MDVGTSPSLVNGNTHALFLIEPSYVQVVEVICADSPSLPSFFPSSTVSPPLAIQCPSSPLVLLPADHFLPTQSSADNDIATVIPCHLSPPLSPALSPSLVSPAFSLISLSCQCYSSPPVLLPSGHLLPWFPHGGGGVQQLRAALGILGLHHGHVRCKQMLSCYG